jgi:hypothetical protein
MAARVEGRVRIESPYRLLRVAVLLAVSAMTLLAANRAFAGGTWSVAGSWQGHLSAAPTANPFVFSVSDTGVGHATRLGAFTTVASELDNFLTGSISEGAFTLTTPSGASVTGTYSGSFTPVGPNTVAFVSPGEITGGTGRFSGATGTIMFSGVGNSATFELSGRFVATLTLPSQ